MSAPSSRAIEAAEALYLRGGIVRTVSPKMALEAAHDPALGLDRSVCLRDVVEVLNAEGAKSLEGVAAYDNGSMVGRAEMRSDQQHYYLAAHLVEREFAS